MNAIDYKNDPGLMHVLDVMATKILALEKQLADATKRPEVQGTAPTGMYL